MDGHLSVSLLGCGVHFKPDGLQRLIPCWGTLVNWSKRGRQQTHTDTSKTLLVRFACCTHGKAKITTFKLEKLVGDLETVFPRFLINVSDDSLQAGVPPRTVDENNGCGA